MPGWSLCPTHELSRDVAVRESEGDKRVTNATSGTRELLHRFSVQLLTDEGLVQELGCVKKCRKCRVIGGMPKWGVKYSIVSPPPMVARHDTTRRAQVSNCGARGEPLCVR